MSVSDKNPKRQSNLSLLDQEFDICTAIAETSGKDSQRALALLKLHAGEPLKQVAEMTGLSSSQIQYLRKIFGEKRLEIFPSQIIADAKMKVGKVELKPEKVRKQHTDTETTKSPKALKIKKTTLEPAADTSINKAEKNDKESADGEGKEKTKVKKDTKDKKDKKDKKNKKNKKNKKDKKKKNQKKDKKKSRKKDKKKKSNKNKKSKRSKK